MNNLPIAFGLHRIQTLQFAMLSLKPELLKGDTEVINELKFLALPQRLGVKVLANFIFQQAEQPLLKLEVSHEFVIQEAAWQALQDDTGQVRLPSGFAQHLAVLAIGSCRGILAAKTEHSPFQDLYLPLINVQDILQEDVILVPSPV